MSITTTRLRGCNVCCEDPGGEFAVFGYIGILDGEVTQRGSELPVQVDPSHVFAAGTQTAVEVQAPAGNGTGDIDNDGIPDAWEMDNGLDPNDPTDAGLDPDDDGLSNLQEFNADTDPNDPDSDDDGIRDGVDLAPAAASNVCVLAMGGGFADFEDTVVMATEVAQCAASVPVNVRPSVVVHPGGKAEIFAPRTDFSPGFALPLGGSLSVFMELVP